MGGKPVVHLAAVPGTVLHFPGVAGRRDFLRAGRAGVQVERQQIAARDFPDRADRKPTGRWKFQCFRIVETAHSGERAEIVIERAVFLHQHHDMLDVAERIFLAAAIARARVVRSAASGPTRRRPRPFRRPSPANAARVSLGESRNHLRGVLRLHGAGLASRGGGGGDRWAGANSDRNSLAFAATTMNAKPADCNIGHRLEATVHRTRREPHPRFFVL